MTEGDRVRVTWPERILTAMADQDQADAAAYQTLVQQWAAAALLERDRQLEVLAAAGCHQCGQPVTIRVVGPEGAQWFACGAEHVQPTAISAAWPAPAQCVGVEGGVYRRATACADCAGWSVEEWTSRPGGGYAYRYDDSAHTCPAVLALVARRQAWLAMMAG